MNAVCLIGRMVKDIEIRITESNVTVGYFTLAVDRAFSKEKEADFIRITVFNKTAESLEKYTRKGSKIAVQGRIQVTNYEDKDGKKVSKTGVVADRVEFLEWLDTEPKVTSGEYSDLGFEEAVTDLPF